MIVHVTINMNIMFNTYVINDIIGNINVSITNDIENDINIE